MMQYGNDPLNGSLDTPFDYETPTPRTKEFVVTSIHDTAMLSQIKATVRGMGASILETSLDDKYFHVALFSDSFIRFIDSKTFRHSEAEIRDHLNRNTDMASFIVVDSDKPLPFQHPRLHRLQDVSLEWIATEIAKGRKWDERECERYRRGTR